MMKKRLTSLIAVVNLGGAGAGNGGTMKNMSGIVIGQELGAESIVRDHPLLFPENYSPPSSFSLVSIIISLRFRHLSSIFLRLNPS